MTSGLIQRNQNLNDIIAHLGHDPSQFTGYYDV